MGLQIPSELMEAISKGRVSLFLGAGASLEAGFPDTNKLAEYLAEKAGKRHSPLLSGQTLDMVADYLYAEPGYGKQWVREKIIDCFEKKHKVVNRPPSQAHELMTKIRWRTIFTTNYDRLIEISYDSNLGCVQRHLPIYTPDAQIRRHESEVVRIIKLNGSVDEAARNSSHEIVLTFADQQQARSRNEEFYNLLRTEATNGPILFVGFSFTHPGAYARGTSPEFSLLRELLKEMGPAARWNYSVTPFDSSSVESQFGIRTLRANQISVINATFSEFMDALFKQLQAHTTPLAERPPIIIPIADASISIDAFEYDKDKRHFEVIGSHLIERTPPTVAESLNGRERWSSFFEGHFIERFCKKGLLTELKECVHKAPEIMSVVAPPGWGKTFLLRDIAVELYQEGRPILWLNPYSTIEVGDDWKASIIAGTWDSARIDRIIGMINEKAKEQSLAEGEGIPIIISDNCPERVEEVLSLFMYLTNNNRSFILVMAVRDNEFDSIIDNHPLLKKSRVFQPEGSYDSREEVRGLIDFCSQHQVATIEDTTQKEIVAQRIIADEADTAIILALQIIFDKEHRPFSEIVKGMWQGLQDEDAQKLVLRVASLHRFGSAFYPRLYSLLYTFPLHTHFEVLDSYNDCLNKGVLFEITYDEEPCVHTLHSLVAEHITKVSGKTTVQLDDELLNIVKQMTEKNDRDLETIRHLLKQINDYNINLSTDDKISELFQVATESTNDDWVVCQQFSKYLLKRDEYELAYTWAERALEKNRDYSSLQHTKGNVLRRWGMALKLEGKNDEADNKFQEARRYFTLSRVGSGPDEYGYVTQLDMIRWLRDRAQDESEKTNLIAEGAQLYREGVRVVPEERLYWLLDSRFNIFDLKGDAIEELCKKIDRAVLEGTSSVYAATFLAEHIYEQGEHDRAVEVLRKQREVSDEGILAWVKEAEFHARGGNLSEAAKCIDSAKRREKYAENAEALWSMMYWDLIIAVVHEDFQDARTAAKRLAGSNLFSRQRLPKGYIWKETAKYVKNSERSFKEHAKIWTGRVQDLRAGGKYGRIELTNAVGDTFYINFNPKYFSRRYSRGDYIKFVITILPSELSAENIDSKPFVNTVDDIFVKG